MTFYINLNLQRATICYLQPITILFMSPKRALSLWRATTFSFQIMKYFTNSRSLHFMCNIHTHCISHYHKYNCSLQILQFNIVHGFMYHLCTYIIYVHILFHFIRKSFQGSFLCLCVITICVQNKMVINSGKTLLS